MEHGRKLWNMERKNLIPQDQEMECHVRTDAPCPKSSGMAHPFFFWAVFCRSGQEKSLAILRACKRLFGNIPFVTALGRCAAGTCRRAAGADGALFYHRHVFYPAHRNVGSSIKGTKTLASHTSKIAKDKKHSVKPALLFAYRRLERHKMIPMIPRTLPSGTVKNSAFNTHERIPHTKPATDAPDSAGPLSRTPLAPDEGYPFPDKSILRSLPAIACLSIFFQCIILYTFL